MPMAPEVRCARAKVAALSRGVRAGERPRKDLEAARRELAAANIEAYVTRTLADAPPLTDEQRTRLAELLKPVRRRAGGAAR